MFLGKIVFIVFIVIAAHFHVLAGILALLLVISMNQYVIEGMEITMILLKNLKKNLVSRCLKKPL